MNLRKSAAKSSYHVKWYVFQKNVIVRLVKSDRYLHLLLKRDKSRRDQEGTSQRRVPVSSKDLYEIYKLVSFLITFLMRLTIMTSLSFLSLILYFSLLVFTNLVVALIKRIPTVF